MTTKATTSQGVKLQRGDGAMTEVFTTIAEIHQFTGPQQSSKQIQVTSLDSTAQEYIAGLRDGGQVAFDMNYVPSDVPQQGLLTDLGSGHASNYKLLLTDGATTPTAIAFKAIVISHQIKGQVDDRIMASVSLKISGTPVFTYGS